MDQSMELYSQPPLNITNCVTVKLNGRNYLLWKTQFESFLSGQGLLGFVTGALKPPDPVLPTPLTTDPAAVVDTVNPAYLSWVKSDQVVRAWLLGSLSEDILSEVVHTKTSQEVWLALAKHFNRVSSSRLFELQRKLQTIEKRDKSMSDYLKEIKSVCEQLDSVGSPVNEKMKIFAALHGLGREYEPIKTSIEGSMDTVPTTFEDISPRLTGFDDRLLAYTDAASITPHLAFNTQRYDSTSYYTKGRGSSNQKWRGKGGYSTQGRGFHQQISSGSSVSSGQSTDGRPVCQICGKIGHPALKCWHRFDNAYQHEDMPAALAALRITDVTDHAGNEWCADSAATAHVTSSPHHLQQSKAYSGSDSVMIGDGNFLPITHTGSALLPTTSGTLPLLDVLVVPDIAKSLLFVSKLTTDYPCSLEFDANGVVVKDKVTKRLLTLGQNKNGLYMLKDSPVQAFYSSRQQAASDEVWHRRLGHPNSKILQHLVNQKAIIINKSTNKMCESCQLGKRSRLPFSDSEFVATRLLERVHCDLWGPSPILSN